MKCCITGCEKEAKIEWMSDTGFCGKRHAFFWFKNQLTPITNTPKCFKCGKPMVNAVDSVTKKISEYLWKPDCDCISKDLRLSVG